MYEEVCNTKKKKGEESKKREEESKIVNIDGRGEGGGGFKR